jgi:hypothetical protein
MYFHPGWSKPAGGFDHGGYHTGDDCYRSVSQASMAEVVNNIFRYLKASSQASLQTYLLPFFNNSIIGFAILAKFRINLR